MSDTTQRRMGVFDRKKNLTELGTPSVTLNNGVRMPKLGLGVYRCSPGQETERTVSFALQNGYRLIDTARLYANEKDVGRALRASGIPRDQVFITTKLWKTDHGYDSTLRAFDASLQDLGSDHIRENASVFDFSIADEDMEAMNAWNENLRLCWDPTGLP